MPSGYRDVKVNPIVNGHLCEIQLHLRDLFSLKQGQHTVYEWARDLRVTAAMQSEYLFENLSSELTQEMIHLAGRNWHGTQDLLSMLLLNNGQFAQAQGALHEVRHVLWLVVDSMLFMHAGFPARDNPRLVRRPRYKQITEVVYALLIADAKKNPPQICIFFAASLLFVCVVSINVAN
ncbi:unnamed protein product, partial [Pylaiella littoralis]